MTIAILGYSCRVPGAKNASQFWDLLAEGRCTVTSVGSDRFETARALHSRPIERGFTYTLAAGLIDEPIGFDHGVFGISPREVAQIDPQQRLLLEVTHEAISHAGLAPQALAGTDTAVFVGASMLDYGNKHTIDPAAIEAHFMTGNSMSVLSNRISYVFDLHGPSATIDTACSSGLVALHNACKAIEAGEAGLAVVAGVNLILSAAPFIGFSRAGMLSPTGRCRSFSAAADGYVRAEGALSFLIGDLETAQRLGVEPIAVIRATGVNSDGRTTGISLPSFDGQKALLESLYGQNDIDPDGLAFIEAHGTGTRVGDPIEATAIGTVLGKTRKTKLPIGSVKSNIGHLEPASGLAGLLKTVLALRNRRLPASLHLDKLNPDIDFDGLGLAPAAEPVDLADRPGPVSAAISSFGFGGTNAHAVIREPTRTERDAARKMPKGAGVRPGHLLLSASGEAGLRAVAAQAADLLDQGGREAAPDLARAFFYRRDLHNNRLMLPIDAETAVRLRIYAGGESLEGGVLATSFRRQAKTAFVFVGNGTQHRGMGRVAYATNPAFRERFDSIDALFRKRAGWSLVDGLQEPEDSERFGRTSFAQPLIFAIQASMCFALAQAGIVPDFVLGHSIGEIAAAEACGALSLAEAVKLIYCRSEVQERAFGLGQMAAIAANEADARQFVAGLELPLEIAAFNGPNSATLTGSKEAIAQAQAAAKERRLAMRALDIQYPFHSSLLDPYRQVFQEALGTLRTAEVRVPFVSTVTGEPLEGAALDSAYWWTNVRAPVQFRRAVEEAAGLGARVFVEIGAKSILANPVSDSLREAGINAEVLPSTFDDRWQDGQDPIADLVMRAVTRGATFAPDALFGPAPRGRIELPIYPWQHDTITIERTAEAVDTFGERPFHPLIGGRLIDDSLEWRAFLDTTTVPYLSDHRLDGEAVVPAAGLAEMLLAAGRAVLGAGGLLLRDFDILRPLVLPDGHMQEVRTVFAASSGLVEVRSRRRLSEEDWILHARGRVSLSEPMPEALPAPRPDDRVFTEQMLYETAAQAGLDYGPHFRLATGARRDDGVLELDLREPLGGAGGFSVPQILDPTVLDAAFHGLFAVYKPGTAGEKRAFLPVRVGALHLAEAPALAVKARLAVDWDTDQTLSATVQLLDAGGGLVAALSEVIFRAVTLSRHEAANTLFHLRDRSLVANSGQRDLAALVSTVLEGARPAAADEDALLDAFAQSLMQRVLSGLVGKRGSSVEDLVEGGKVAVPARQLASRLLHILGSYGLAGEGETAWTVPRKTGLPAPEAILRTLVAHYPGSVIENAIAAQLVGELPARLADGERPTLRQTLLEQLASAGRFHAGALRDVHALLSGALAATQPGSTLRLLVAQPDGVGLLHALAAFAADERLEVFVTGREQAALEHLRARHRSSPRLGFVHADDLPQRHFDLAVVLAGPEGRTGHADLLPQLNAALVPGAEICVFAPTLRAFPALVWAVIDTAAPSAVSDFFPEPLLADATTLATRLAGSGFGEVVRHERADGTWLRARAESRAAAPQDGQGRDFLLVSAKPLPVLTKALAGRFRSVQGAADPAEAERLLAAGGTEILFVVDDYEASPLEALTGLIMEIVGFAKLAEQGLKAVWVVTRNGFGATRMDTEPVSHGLRSFCRVLANEFPAVAVRSIDIADMEIEAAVYGLMGVLEQPGTETEFVLRPEGLSVLRADRGLPLVTRAGVPAEAARLDFRRRGSFESFVWKAAERTAPAAGAIEIAVAATGLNFRDVMFSLGILPEEILRGGFAGAVVGFECAGTISRVGAGVDPALVGRRVMAFAPAAFGSHVTIPQGLAIEVPADVSLEAAATMPVAFLTAWYALVTKADIRRGEWVLIHGAAGAVGLAALQIAKLKGAKVAATAGSPDKRAFAMLAGADRVYDSRSLAFADDILRDLGGVDIVLNSLAGDAMAASIRTLKPFGRFIELGKRDFVENTQIGLRPFRSNLSYFGVDVDHLLEHDVRDAAKILRQLEKEFRRERLLPLPYRAFEAHEVAEAFRLMQASGHIGKIVIAPPADMPDIAVREAFRADGDKVYLVVGGLTGFGFETAAWLVERGARKVVVASRRGQVEPEIAERIEALREKGATFVVEAVDATDFQALKRLRARIEAAYGPIGGVFHTAVVLDDAVLVSVTGEQVERVLAPKVAGAQNLDRLFATADLDLFVVYSSVSAMIGNPGQGAYVAANAYMEGIVRRRRQKGLAGLAVAWGRISDVGLLARDAELDNKVARIMGGKGLRADEALAMLGDILGSRDAFGLNGTVTCAPMHSSAAARSLAIVRSPTFAGLYDGRGDQDAAETVDLRELIAGKNDGEARDIIGGLVAEQVARILRIAPSEIDLGRPLSELGLDSLMALELRLQIGEKFGIELPLVAISAGKSLGELSARLVTALREGDTPESPIAGIAVEDVSAALSQHTGETVTVDAEKIDAFVSIVEKSDVVVEKPDSVRGAT